MDDMIIHDIVIENKFLLCCFCFVSKWVVVILCLLCAQVTSLFTTWCRWEASLRGREGGSPFGVVAERGPSLGVGEIRALVRRGCEEWVVWKVISSIYTDRHVLSSIFVLWHVSSVSECVLVWPLAVFSIGLVSRQVSPLALFGIGLVAPIPHIRICVWVSPRAVFSIGLVAHTPVSISGSVATCCVRICRCQMSVWSGSLQCGHVEARCLFLNHFMHTDFCVIDYFIVRSI